MRPVERQDLAAILAKYSLHPEFRDVYVEASADQGLITWFLEDNGLHHVNVYPISSFEISEETVRHYGLTFPSKRNELIALGMELEKNIGKDLHVKCVVDADFDPLFQTKTESSLVLSTDYTSMEMYGYTSDLVQKILRIVVPKVTKTGEEVLAELQPILQSLYAMRATNIDLGYGLSWVSFDRCCRFDGEIHVDLNELMKRYLNTNGRLRDLAAFDERFKQLKATFTGDPRLYIRGHDFIEALTWYLKMWKPGTAVNEDLVRSIVYSGLTSKQLLDSSLFKALLHIGQTDK